MDVKQKCYKRDRSIDEKNGITSSKLGYVWNNHCTENVHVYCSIGLVIKEDFWIYTVVGLNLKKNEEQNQLVYHIVDLNEIDVCNTGWKKGFPFRGNIRETTWKPCMHYTHLYFIILNHYVSMWMELITITNFCRNYSYYHALHNELACVWNECIA